MQQKFGPFAKSHGANRNPILQFSNLILLYLINKVLFLAFSVIEKKKKAECQIKVITGKTSKN